MPITQKKGTSLSLFLFFDASIVESYSAAGASSGATGA